MNANLRNKLAAAIATGATAAGIAGVLLGSGNDGVEGLRHTPYRDVAGVLTVCHGHTGRDIEQRYYTTKECDDLLQRDLAKVAKQVDPLIKVPVTNTQRAAVYSFAYNVGAGAFSRSTMLRYINEVRMPEACAELRRWVYAGGQKWNGLISRREVEKQVCEWQQQPVKTLLTSSPRS